MDERFNKWLLTPVLTLLFVVIMYQYVSPSCTSSCANFREQPRAGEASQPAAPGPARRAQVPLEDWERRPQLPPPPRGPPEGPLGAVAPEDEDEEPGAREEEEEEEGEEEEEQEEETLPAPLNMPLSVNGGQTRKGLKTAREFCAGKA